MDFNRETGAVIGALRPERPARPTAASRDMRDPIFDNTIQAARR